MLCLALFIFSAFLLLLSLLDLKTLRLPNFLTHSLLWCGLSCNAFALFTNPASAILGAIAGYLSLFFISKIYRYIRQQEGLGLGDAKLLAAIGAWLGWQALPLIVFNAALFNLSWALMLILNKKSRHIKLATYRFPFGPALAFSSIAAMIGQVFK